MNATSGYAEINGAALHYETSGAGTPIVFIHGYGLDKRMWDDQAHFFGPNNLVVRYDLRGFGKSSLPGKEQYSHPSDLKALLDHLNISQAHVVGLSMGGRVAVEFAISYPQHVLSLVLADSGLNGYVSKGVLFEDIIAKAPSIGPAAANKMWLNHSIFNPARQHSHVAKRLEQMINDYSGWHWMNDNRSVSLDPPAMEQLHKINAKTMVIVGEKDLEDYHETADILAQKIPVTIKHIIPKAGHMSNMESPAIFNEIVFDFL